MDIISAFGLIIVGGALGYFVGAFMFAKTLREKLKKMGVDEATIKEMMKQ